jgi:hypothetical protein
MSFKVFKLKVGDDLIPFNRIEIDDSTGVPTEPNEVGIYEMLLSNPKVVNVNHLDYVPLIGSVWDGTGFTDPLNQDVRPVIRRDPDPTRFSFMVDNKHLIYYVIPSDERNAMVVAALSSDPEIIVE